MRKLNELDEIRADLEIFVEKTAKQMGESAIDSQFAFVLMLDKQIYLLVPRGVKIPERILKITDGFEFYDKDNMKTCLDASKKLIERAFVAQR